MKEWNDISYRGSRYPLQANLTIFWICSVLFSLYIFLHGFFPMKTVVGEFAVKNDIPSTILNFSIDNEVLYRRRSGRFVFVLIDAFRWDFLDNPEHMPYLFELQKSRKASLLTARCHPPTATMPRIKALMTGTVPNYVDVILNLGNDQVTEDNLVHQAVENGLKVVFYGDEVWLHLFPEKFLRKEGTTSFFVSDYSEVDTNVTRHIAPEMKKGDWDILILHYLGLDHIGHLAGPSSPLVPFKLREMDEAIREIHESLQQWDYEHPEEPSYLVIVGDHGMHDLGSHGGATLGEILVSLIVIENVALNYSISENSNFTRPEVSQIDVTATLAVLLGLPIPKLSLGVLIPSALKRLTDEQFLFGLGYNAQQVSSQFILADPDGTSKDCFNMFLRAKEAHVSWLKSKSNTQRDLAKTLYTNATQQMSSLLVKTLVTFDMFSLGIGCFTFIQVLLSLLYSVIVKRKDIFLKSRGETSGIFTTGIGLFAFCILFSCICSSLFPISVAYLIFATLSLFFIGLHCWILCVWFNTCQVKKFRNISVTTTFLIVGSLLHTISLSASSLIEEEHQTWYFLWITFMLILFFSSSFSDPKFSFHQFQLFSIMLGHRILRKLNQTGDKWASLPDIADWLEMTDNKVILSYVFSFGLVAVWFSLHRLKCLNKTSDKVLHFLAILCVFLYRSTVGDLSLSFILGDPRGVRIVQLFWLINGLLLLKSLRKPSQVQIIKGLISVWTLASALLFRPCNVILIPYFTLSSLFISSVMKKTVDCCLALLWLGNVAFFYQGNSNSLSTINVAAGYIGADYQNIFGAGLLIFIHTYCFPVLSTLLLFLRSTSQTDFIQRKQDIISTLHVCFLHRLLPLCAYCIIVTLQRHHLFIWSVFAPKLLYEAVHSVISFKLIAVGCVLLLFCDKE
ncbi:GPI ethanolamine phosphate transferase 2 isoform X1 [Frankliniella occidentalis]|uniref:GPI ethanolamine phosphate transferase 2 isoform X1 n=2 Tax=Frankliniella occidentalis TaxID=133901 RepID=A0A6J1SZ18_FRAOC|nr:GPI ethanolamine phosphate transferase 2 isoform X1 [Frankliniella occidentalis]